MKKICCVIVTYNRKDLLIECLECVKNQTFKPHTVLIVDNASTDGTIELVKSHGYYNTVIDGVVFNYLLLPNNQGGAGGFFNGIKTAHQSNECFDGIWVMDDDGKPDIHCLEYLVNYLPEYDYLAPLVIAMEDSTRLAFNYHGSFSIKQLIETSDKLIPEYACPFNGILFSRKLVDTIGYPIPQLFIWGDEFNYTMRAKDAGFIPYTVTDAFHTHPSDRMKIAKSFMGKEVIEVPNKWKGYCHWRNAIFNSKGRWKFSSYIKYYIIEAYFLLFKKKDCSLYLVFNEAFFSGFKKIPDDGYRKYMK